MLAGLDQENAPRGKAVGERPGAEEGGGASKKRGASERAGPCRSLSYISILEKWNYLWQKVIPRTCRFFNVATGRQKKGAYHSASDTPLMRLNQDYSSSNGSSVAAASSGAAALGLAPENSIFSARSSSRAPG